jgi:hypothetical protein
MKPDEPKKREWPRFAIGPLGNRARFEYLGAVPHGWRLEIPLPGQSVTPTPPPVPPAPVADDLAAARAEYKTVFGKRAGPQWDAGTIRQKIKDRA